MVWKFLVVTSAAFAIGFVGGYGYVHLVQQMAQVAATAPVLDACTQLVEELRQVKAAMVREEEAARKFFTTEPRGAVPQLRP